MCTNMVLIVAFDVNMTNNGPDNIVLLKTDIYLDVSRSHIRNLYYNSP